MAAVMWDGVSAKVAQFLVTSAELLAYFQSLIQSGTQENQVKAGVEEKVTQIAGSWQDSKAGTSYQQTCALEIAERAARLQEQVSQTIRTWAAPDDVRVLNEVIGALQQALVERDRLLLELRERLNASPY